MQSHFTAEFFSGNRQKLIRRLQPDGPVILSAHGHVQRSADTTYPFTQESNFYYLTGLNIADCIVVVDESETYIILPPRNHIQDVFDGAIDTAQAAQHSGIDMFYEHHDGWRKLRSKLAVSKTAYTLLPGPVYHVQYAMYLNPSRRQLVQKMKRHAPQLMLHDIREVCAELRAVKQPAELAALKQAIAITTETLDSVRMQKQLQRYAHEYELEAAITAGFRSRGATDHSFSPIVANGIDATTIHHIANNGVIDPSALTVVDIGAEVEHYAADITRTICARPLSTRQKAVYDAVARVAANARNSLKPGVLMHDHELAVEQAIGTELVGLGLITNAADRSAIRHYYPHAVSHFLGLDAHDAGEYAKPLAAGMVVTCEPGIYIPEEALGIRIEDDILITETGHENLSAGCSYEPFIA